MSRVPTTRQALHAAHPAQKWLDTAMDITLAFIILTWPVLFLLTFIAYWPI